MLPDWKRFIVVLTIALTAIGSLDTAVANTSTSIEETNPNFQPKREKIPFGEMVPNCLEVLNEYDCTFPLIFLLSEVRGSETDLRAFPLTAQNSIRAKFSRRDIEGITKCEARHVDALKTISDGILKQRSAELAIHEIPSELSHCIRIRSTDEKPHQIWILTSPNSLRGSLECSPKNYLGRNSCEIVLDAPQTGQYVRIGPLVMERIFDWHSFLFKAGKLLEGPTCAVCEEILELENLQ